MKLPADTFAYVVSVTRLKCLELVATISQYFHSGGGGIGKDPTPSILDALWFTPSANSDRSIPSDATSEPSRSFARLCVSLSSITGNSFFGGSNPSRG